MSYGDGASHGDSASSAAATAAAGPPCEVSMTVADAHGSAVRRIASRTSGVASDTEEPPASRRTIRAVGLLRRDLAAELHQLARGLDSQLTSGIPRPGIDPRGIEDHRLGPTDGLSARCRSSP